MWQALLGGMSGGSGGLASSAMSMGSGMMEMMGAHAQGKHQEKMVKDQRQFIERMSNTAYQRAMADMKEAGLNPMLAYKQGGAGAPSGGIGGSPDIPGAMHGAASTAMAGRRLFQELKNMKATQGQLEALTAKAQGEASSAASRALIDGLRASLLSTPKGMDILELQEHQKGGHMAGLMKLFEIMGTRSAGEIADFFEEMRKGNFGFELDNK